jgi:hypothetical protein
MEAHKVTWWEHNINEQCILPVKDGSNGQNIFLEQ